MENIPKFDPRRPEKAGLDVENKDKCLADLSTLLREKKAHELIGTFQAGAIPIILDTLARDTSDKGQKIVAALYKMIEDLKQYYNDREPKVEKKKEEEIKLPVRKPQPG